VPTHHRERLSLKHFVHVDVEDLREAVEGARPKAVRGMEESV
jgi:hypothetical protein